MLILKLNKQYYYSHIYIINIIYFNKYKYTWEETYCYQNITNIYSSKIWQNLPIIQFSFILIKYKF